MVCKSERCSSAVPLESYCGSAADSTCAPESTVCLLCQSNSVPEMMTKSWTPYRLQLRDQSPSSLVLRSDNIIFWIDISQTASLSQAFQLFHWNDYFWPFDVAVRIVPSRVREVKISTSSMRSKLSPLSLLYFLSFSVSSFGWPQLLLLFSCSSYIHRDSIYFSFYPYPPPQPNVHLSLPPHSGFLSYSGCCWDLCPNPCCQVHHFSWPFWTHMGKRTGGFASIFIGWNIRILWKKNWIMLVDH